MVEWAKLEPTGAPEQTSDDRQAVFLRSHGVAFFLPLARSTSAPDGRAALESRSR